MGMDITLRENGKEIAYVSGSNLMEDDDGLIITSSQAMRTIFNWCWLNNLYTKEEERDYGVKCKVDLLSLEHSLQIANALTSLAILDKCKLKLIQKMYWEARDSLSEEEEPDLEITISW